MIGGLVKESRVDMVMQPHHVKREWGGDYNELRMG